MPRTRVLALTMHTGEFFVSRAFSAEREQGVIDGLVLAPSDRSAVQSTMDLLYRQRALGQTIGSITTVLPAAKATRDEEVDSINSSIADLSQSDGFSVGSSLSFGSAPADLVQAVDADRPGVVLAVVTTRQERDIEARLRDGDAPNAGTCWAP